VEVSLWGIFKQYEHDINVVDTFINKGMFGEAKNKMKLMMRLKDFVDNNSMRKDYVNLMGSRFHLKLFLCLFIQILMLWMKESFLQEIPYS
jgi:hypothetical protein